MTYSTVSDVRSMVETTTTDDIINEILNDAYRWVTTNTNASIYSNWLHIAEVYFARARLLEYCKTTGELAYYNKMGNIATYNQIDKDIERFDSISENALMSHTLYVTQQTTGSIAPIGITKRHCGGRYGSSAFRYQ